MVTKIDSVFLGEDDFCGRICQYLNMVTLWWYRIRLKRRQTHFFSTVCGRGQNTSISEQKVKKRRLCHSFFLIEGICCKVSWVNKVGQCSFIQDMICIAKEIGDKEPYYSTKILIFSFFLGWSGCFTQYNEGCAKLIYWFSEV